MPATESAGDDAVGVNAPRDGEPTARKHFLSDGARRFGRVDRAASRNFVTIVTNFRNFFDAILRLAIKSYRDCEMSFSCGRLARCCQNDTTQALTLHICENSSRGTCVAAIFRLSRRQAVLFSVSQNGKRGNIS